VAPSVAVGRYFSDKGKADLRELANLGYSVKDKDKKQYWRAAG
jgi:hypothetical protein